MPYHNASIVVVAIISEHYVFRTEEFSSSSTLLLQILTSNLPSELETLYPSVLFRQPYLMRGNSQRLSNNTVLGGPLHSTSLICKRVITVRPIPVPTYSSGNKSGFHPRDHSSTFCLFVMLVKLISTLLNVLEHAEHPAQIHQTIVARTSRQYQLGDQLILSCCVSLTSFSQLCISNPHYHPETSTRPIRVYSTGS